MKRERERVGRGERGIVRAKRMTVIRPIIGWHQKCWVWLACQMGNSRRTAEASYSCSYGPTDSARGLYGSPFPTSFPPSELSHSLGMIWTCTVRRLLDDVNGNRRKIISPRRIRRFSTGMTSWELARSWTETRRNCKNPIGIRTSHGELSVSQIAFEYSCNAAGRRLLKNREAVSIIDTWS